MDNAEKKITLLDVLQRDTGIPMERLQALWNKEQEPTAEEVVKLGEALLARKIDTLESQLAG